MPRALCFAIALFPFMPLVAGAAGFDRFAVSGMRYTGTENSQFNSDVTISAGADFGGFLVQGDIQANADKNGHTLYIVGAQLGYQVTPDLTAAVYFGNLSYSEYDAAQTAFRPVVAG